MMTMAFWLSVAEISKKTKKENKQESLFLSTDGKLVTRA